MKINEEVGYGDKGTRWKWYKTFIMKMEDEEIYFHVDPHDGLHIWLNARVSISSNGLRGLRSRRKKIGSYPLNQNI